MKILIHLWIVALLVIGTSGFAAEKNNNDEYFDDEEENVRIADPIEPWNRAMFHVNDKLYFWVMKPLAQGYKAVTPEIVRIGVKNFFHNLTTPIRFVNCMLQGKPKAASEELGSFMVNTVVGVLGFGDPAKNNPHIKPHDEDLGQTLAVYGIGDGFYIVWPFFGPSTLRDSVGLGGDRFLDPVSYVKPSAASTGIDLYDQVNALSFRIGDYESLKEAAINPYEAFRNAYMQYRRKKIKE